MGLKPNDNPYYTEYTMEDEKRPCAESHLIHNPSGSVASSSLESAQSYVAECTKSGCEGNERGKEFSIAFGCIVEWAQAQKLIIQSAQCLYLQRPTDAHGQEHEAWFDESDNRWFKVTYPNQFGLAWGKRGSATPCAYLTRLVLQNRYFGDDIHLVSLIEVKKKLRVLTSQPHIAGENASADEIQGWFSKYGFINFRTDDGCSAWYKASVNLLVADAHEGNVIRDRNDVLVPIDLNIIHPDGELLEMVKEAVAQK
jgi:hypothetical protein